MTEILEEASPTDLEVFRAKAMLLRLRHERELADIDLDRCLEDFGWFCRKCIQTVYTDPNTMQRSFRQYPDYEYLNEYSKELWTPGLLVVPKSREVLATTHPLIEALWQCFRVWKRGGIFKAAIVRQNLLHARDLISRVRQTWERMPSVAQPPLIIDNLDRLQFAGNGEFRALPEEGETGRGEDWDRVILDEGAFQEHLAENIGAFAARSTLVLVPSTFNGEGDTFSNLVDGIGYPGRRVLTLMYSVHPDRKPGTESGEQYLANQRAKMSDSDFRREILGERNVYSRQGYYGQDYKPEVVRSVEWDGQAAIVIGMDYSYTNPAAVIAYANSNDQWCRLREYKEVDMGRKAFCQLVFDDCVRLYPKALFRVAPDPFRGRQTKGDEDKIGNPVTDIAVITALAHDILGPETRICHKRSEKLMVAEGHDIVRRLFKRRDDGNFGTIIDPKCIQLIQGFAGAYGPPENATPQQLEREEPDKRRIQVHIMDADRYGVIESVMGDRGLSMYRKPKEQRGWQPEAIFDDTGYLRGYVNA